MSLAVIPVPTTSFKVFECIDMQSSMDHIHTPNLVKILIALGVGEDVVKYKGIGSTDKKNNDTFFSFGVKKDPTTFY